MVLELCLGRLYDSLAVKDIDRTTPNGVKVLGHFGSMHKAIVTLRCALQCLSESGSILTDNHLEPSLEKKNEHSAGWRGSKCAVRTSPQNKGNSTVRT